MPIVLPHTHICPECQESFECFCTVPNDVRRCSDCSLQLRLLEYKN